MKKYLFASAALLCLAGSANTASALMVDALLTADNHYALYHGGEFGTPLTYVSKNETGSLGSPGTYNWSEPEFSTFSMNAGEYIYVVGWSDDYVAQGWIGQFKFGSETVYSNTTDWEFFAANQNLGNGYDWTDAADTVGLQAKISTAVWAAVPNSIDHGNGPWGTIPGIDLQADWIWGGLLSPGVNVGEYLVFRTKIDPIPEPATMLLFGAGLAGLAGSRLRRKK